MCICAPFITSRNKLLISFLALCSAKILTEIKYMSSIESVVSNPYQSLLIPTIKISNEMKNKYSLVAIQSHVYHSVSSCAEAV